MKRPIVAACVVLCLSLSASASEPPPTYPVAPAAEAIVSADFNRDGRPDLAAASYDTVSVLLGNGDGTFQPALNSPTGPSWYSLAAVGDFDLDGDPDLATANAILLGNGDGTFAAPSPGLSWMGVTVGDVDGDGKADLVGLTDAGCDDYYCYGVVTVQLGNGDGTFASPWVSWDGLTVPGPIALGDFDGDGALDVITPAGLQLGNGDGTLRSPDGSYPGSSGVADLNGDGELDVVGDSQGYGVYGIVFTQLGNGDGTFQSGVYAFVDTAFGHMALADYNGDAKPDVAIRSSYGVEILLGNGDGTLRHAGRLGYDPAYYTTVGLAAGDFDGDGLSDLAATGWRYDDAYSAWESGVSVFLNEASFNAPSMTISDATVTEGHGGTRAVSFTVNLSSAHSQAVTVEYATADGTAAAPGDYQAAAGTLTIDAGETSGTITVLVNGDRVAESAETFTLNLAHATNAFLFDLQGVAIILDDEPFLTVSSGGSKAEGQRRQKTPFPFLVTLSSAYDEAVTVSYATANGWGTASQNDYVALSGSLTFNPGETAKTVTVYVKGDTKREADETFVLRLYGQSASVTLSNTYNSATILNDD